MTRVWGESHLLKAKGRGIFQSVPPRVAWCCSGTCRPMGAILLEIGRHQHGQHTKDYIKGCHGVVSVALFSA